jgi:type I secretion outer membrane protein, tolC family
MKKAIVLSLVASGILFAQEAKYNIFVRSFPHSGDNGKIENFRKSVEEKVGDYANVSKVLSERYDNYQFVVITTNAIEKDDVKKLLSKVRAAGYKDAYSLKRDPARDAASIQEKDEISHTDLDKGDIATEEDKRPIFDEEKIEKTDTEQSASANQLTLAQVVKTVLEENPGFRQTEFAYMQVGKDLNIANNAYYPTLDVSGTFGREGKKQDYRYNDGTKRKQSGSGNKTTATATLVENIYNGGADKNRIISQSHRLDAAAFSVAQKADRLTLQVVDAYLEVLSNKRLLEIAEGNVKTHEEIYEQIKERTSTGFARSSEERQAGSRLALAQSNLVAQENNYNDALTTFEKLYGKKINPESLVTPQVDVNLPTTESFVFDKAMQCNPSVRIEESNIKMAESLSNEKNAPFRPKLDFEASASYEKDNVFYDKYTEKTYDVLLRLRYNLYNKGIDKLEKEKSKLAISESISSMDSVKRDLTESLKFSWQSYSLDEKKLEYLAKHVGYAEETLEAYRDEFKIGRRDLINLLDAESEYNNALEEQVKTQKTFLYSKYRLLDNMGMITDSFEPGFAKKYIQGACSIQEDLK